MALASLGTYHVRGMTDVAGSPGVEIATVKVDVYGDASIRFTAANGASVQIRDVEAFKLLSEALGVTLFG